MSLLMSIFISCQSQDTIYNKLKNYLYTISDTLDIDKYESIFYVSEVGCPTCAKSFSNTIQTYVFDKTNALIILNAKGRVVDITPYREGGHSNVVFDYTSNFFRLHLASTSCIITFKDHSVDTIIELNASQLGSQLNLIPEIVRIKKE
jgi:hypothetical protein